MNSAHLALLSGKGIVILLILIGSSTANATTLTCGLKTVTVEGNSITKLVHEDGTVQTGRSVSDNWSYDGKAIVHRIMNEPIPCGSKPKSRDEVIAELSGRFSKSPKSYGMTPKEAQLMGQYTAALMKRDSACYLLVDAAKSTARQEMFYIDCNDKQSKTRRYWVSQSDLANGVARKAATPVERSDAVSICNSELKARAANPSTYAPSLALGTSTRADERTGRNVVEIEFESANSFGVVTKHVGNCILEAGQPIEVTIKNR